MDTPYVGKKPLDPFGRDKAEEEVLDLFDEMRGAVADVREILDDLAHAVDRVLEDDEARK